MGGGNQPVCEIIIIATLDKDTKTMYGEIALARHRGQHTKPHVALPASLFTQFHGHDASIQLLPDPLRACLSPRSASTIKARNALYDETHCKNITGFPARLALLLLNLPALGLVEAVDLEELGSACRKKHHKLASSVSAKPSVVRGTYKNSPSSQSCRRGCSGT